MHRQATQHLSHSFLPLTWMHHVPAHRVPRTAPCMPYSGHLAVLRRTVLVAAYRTVPPGCTQVCTRLPMGGRVRGCVLGFDDGHLLGRRSKTSAALLATAVSGGVAGRCSACRVRHFLRKRHGRRDLTAIMCRAPALASIPHAYHPDHHPGDHGHKVMADLMVHLLQRTAVVRACCDGCSDGGGCFHEPMTRIRIRG